MAPDTSSLPYNDKIRNIEEKALLLAEQLFEFELMYDLLPAGPERTNVDREIQKLRRRIEELRAEFKALEAELKAR